MVKRVYTNSMCTDARNCIVGRGKVKGNPVECGNASIAWLVDEFLFKKRKESCGFRAAQKTTERKRTEKKTEKTGVASYKTFEREEIGSLS